MKFRYWIFSILLLISIGLSLHLFQTRPLETNVMELIPEGKNNPEVSLARKLVSSHQSKINYVVLSSPNSSITPKAVSTFASTLKENPSIASVYSPSDSVFLKDIGEELVQLRFSWMLPKWLNSHFPNWKEHPPDSDTLANKVVEELNTFLESPESFMWDELIPRDPFLLIPRQALDARSFIAPKHPQNQVFWIEQSPSPLEAKGQEPVFTAFNMALQNAKKHDPDLQLSFTGVGKFAHASEQNIRSEVTRLNLLAIIFVLFILIAWIRDIRILFKLSFVLLLSLFSAFSLTFIIFPNLHILSLVMGSLLIGVAVDYGLHRFLHFDTDNKFILWRPLLISACSSAGGFALLMLSPLPVVNQLGCFVAIGLITALIGASLLPPNSQNNGPPQKPRIHPFNFIPIPVALSITIALCLGTYFLSWQDNIKDLDYPVPELQNEHESVLSHFNQNLTSNPVLVIGESLVDTRKHLETILQELKNKSQVWSPAQFIPQFNEASKAHDLFKERPDFVPALKRELATSEYSVEAFDPFFNDYNEYSDATMNRDLFEQQIRSFAQSLPSFLQSMISTDNPIWMMAFVPENFKSASHEFIYPLAEVENLNRSFSQYRKDSGKIAVIAGITIVLLLPVVFQGRKGMISAFLLSINVLATLGTLSFVFHDLGLFHLIGILLGFCLCLDYLLFAVESTSNHRSLPVSVLVSMVTTAGVFGLLITSAIPAVQALGSSVVIMLLICLLLLITSFQNILTKKKPIFPGHG